MLEKIFDHGIIEPGRVYKKTICLLLYMNLIYNESHLGLVTYQTQLYAPLMSQHRIHYINVDVNHRMRVNRIGSCIERLKICLRFP